MEQAMEQCRLETKSSEFQKKQILNENDRLLEQIISQDIFNILVNSSVDINDFVNVNVNSIEMCNKCLELEAELIKQHNMEKVFCDNSIKNDLKKLKGKDIVDNAAQVSNATTIASRMYKLDPVTLAPKDKNNRETHIYYLNTSYSACKYDKLIQGLLGYVKDTCPDIHKPRVSQSTKSCRSKSIDNTKNDRILQISSSAQKKNKVKNHSGIVKSCLNKPNCVVEPSRNANVQHSKLNTNSELMCIKCNSSMFDARHELCFLEFVSDMNAFSKSKSVKKAKKKEE
ncbi:hypothetical protein Tco_0721098 [Tanacetum coccineum]